MIANDPLTPLVARGRTAIFRLVRTCPFFNPADMNSTALTGLGPTFFLSCLAGADFAAAAGFFVSLAGMMMYGCTQDDAEKSWILRWEPGKFNFIQTWRGKPWTNMRTWSLDLTWNHDQTKMVVIPVDIQHLTSPSWWCICNNHLIEYSISPLWSLILLYCFRSVWIEI